MLTQQDNISRVEAEIRGIMARQPESTFVLIDGDRTLIPNDSTRNFFAELDLDFNDIKRIFQQHGCAFEAFLNVALFYSNIERMRYEAACAECAKQVQIYPGFLAFIEAIRSRVHVIVVTAGIAQLWREVICNHSLDFVSVIGGNYFPTDRYVIDRQAKGIIVNTLKQSNKSVFAFGDTVVDFEMLQLADSPFMVVNERQNKDLVPVAHKIPGLSQISFSEHLHPNIPTSTLLQVAEEILKA